MSKVTNRERRAILLLLIVVVAILFLTKYLPSACNGPQTAKSNETTANIVLKPDTLKQQPDTIDNKKKTRKQTKENNKKKNQPRPITSPLDNPLEKKK